MKIDFPISSNPGTVTHEADGRLINAMVEKAGDNIKWIRQPGVTEWATSGDENFRGMAISRDNIVYAAYTETLNRVDSSLGGAMEFVGTLPGTNKARFAFNQNLTPDQVVVTNIGANVFTTTSISAYPDLDLPVVVDVCFGIGFFFFITSSGRCYSSGINTTTVDPAHFVTAEAKPDGLSRCLYFNDQLYLLGPDSIEVWGKPINPSLFPLNRVTVIPRGIAGPDCVTGTENGIDLGLIIISKNDQVMRVNGYQPERISVPDVERDIARVADKTTLEMTSFVCDGHMYVKVRSPVWTWLYDLTTQCWVERKSYLSETNRTQQALSAHGFWVVGDNDSGNIGRIDPENYTEYDQPLVWECWSKRPEPFPYRAVVGPAYFNFVPGRGDALGLDPIQRRPRVNISWSDDGGLSFVPPRICELNRQGVAAPMSAKVNLTGSTGAYGRVWKVRVSDPVYVSFRGGDMPKISRRAVA
jgi:hypothetical protein